ncbi:hypothetical protein EDD21DRAFT_418091 [Dissophora ornata]|nr:hypothetical protein BGZ58_001627 [Dissophora ornata]KAI8598087.1 hypothetical protein EDD21DRAFT_418091 [Dissophora ornata]
MAPFELQQEVLPIHLPMQPLNISRRRTSRIITRSDTAAAVAAATSSGVAVTSDQIEMMKMMGSKPASGSDSVSYTIQSLSPVAGSTGPMPSSGTAAASESSSSTESTHTYTSPLAWLSRVITKAGRDERLHYHPNGQHHHSHGYNTRSQSHLHGHQQLHSHSHSHHHHHHSSSSSLSKQLFSKATVVTLEQKYATVHWAAEFYCTISSPCFALPLLLYLDPTFRWSAPEIHTTHFTILLSVITAITSTLYHATLYKIFSSLDACFATIMFYLNTIQLLRSLPDPYAMMVPDLISTAVHWGWTPYLLTSGMMALFIFSWKRTAMLSLLLMVLMIPATIWGFVVHESWVGLAFGLLGLSMFAADRFKLFCGHSYWHLAGGLSLWYGIASGALAK